MHVSPRPTSISRRGRSETMPLHTSIHLAEEAHWQVPPVFGMVELEKEYFELERYGMG